jgi:dTDP-4-dehydrorhamnose 3,5-epimerase
MQVTHISEVDGVILFTPRVHHDERGFFSRTYDAAIMQGLTSETGFAQDSVSRSVKGVIRGLHTRGGQGESKLVRCSYGSIFDVVVDLRPGSPTYRIWKSFELNGEDQQTLFVPAGCAHGFQALSEIADVSYRIDRPHDPTEDVAIAFDDPELAIPWPLPPSVMSPRDRTASPLAALEAAGI